MTTKSYNFITEDSLTPIGEFCRDIARTREDDIRDFANLSNIFMRGRKVGKIPANSADTTGDRVGDFNYATDSGTEYLYICMDVSGTAVWRRVALGGF